MSAVHHVERGEPPPWMCGPFPNSFFENPFDAHAAKSVAAQRFSRNYHTTLKSYDIFQFDFHRNFSLSLKHLFYFIFNSAQGGPMKKLYLTLMLILFFATAAFAKVNINTATMEELTTLNGIGKTKAEAIVAYRTANGDFKTVDDLAKVKGIGDKIIEKIKPEITVGE
ncbi:ComEA family DNA-binding protein [Desulfobulbus elongatus]|uniref:ComEA family DNA-binding protein n=1 Tax=Desulfobulbus elongatus TaxID=53332 RepID=UPI0024817565|nr:ComEA family DNA-binding protein [Desulfobulbus elongatus]